jgi:hypothetical protein
MMLGRSLIGLLLLLGTTIPASAQLEPWVLVRAETEVYGEDGSLQWIAQPGERYRFIELDETGAWLHIGEVGATYWMAADERAEQITIDVTPPPPPPTPVAQPTARPAPTAPAAAPGLRPGFNPNSYIGQGDRYNCGDFQSQAEAQAVLRADPRDPNRLDADRDGIACENNRAPRDTVRVPR